jgi:predicted RNA-binding Zn-ribbon protein involved in translation (DUF1610 family)
VEKQRPRLRWILPLVISQEGMSRKINLERVRQSLDTVCTLCGYAIPPEQVRRTGYDRVICPQCGKEFVPQKTKQD